MKNLSSNKGITLTMLVITIIVILIITGISITGAITGVDSANDSRAITDLEKVKHAVTQRYSKFKLTKDKSLLVGTKVELSELTDVPESINWRVFQFTIGETTSQYPERKYYRLSKSDLESLGFSGDYKGSSYIVNYSSGEVYDEGQKQTSDGKALYKTAISEEISELGDNIIQNGLQVWYDAINNTGSGHSSSTKTWFDLSGNNNHGKMSNVTMGSNYADFNGKSSWVNIGIIDYKHQTISVTFSVPQNFNHCQGLINNFEGSGGGLQLNPQIEGMFMINSSYQRIKSKETIKNGKKYNAAITFNGEKEILYIDGKEYDKINIVGNIIKSTKTVMAIGCNPSGSNATSEYFKGKIYSAKIYNRALSTDEIHHNYIIDKNRYGIEE